ncbi:MAG: cupredoxin domain-containing protein [Leptolyngbyaceae cyanobacterium bins.302]|nr:cupredoxin domain-containing protein [Leptolyngbyaceae cyanobacterium bins.302]
MKKTIFWGTLAGFGFLLGAISGAIAAEVPEHSMESMPRSSENVGQFQRIEQPLGNKVAVTLGGLGLIGLELWWFLFNKPKSRQASTEGGIQEVTVIVDGGYEPSHVVVQAGQPVRLNFDRKDSSSCLEEVRFPDFRIAQALTLNQVTPIEFTPDKPGRYEFTCGMNMFRGVVEAQAGDTPTAKPSVPTSQPVHPVDHSAAL